MLKFFCYAERQHIETNLKVNLSEVSVAFFFFDEDPMDVQDSVDHISVDSNLHYLGSRWVDIVIMMQVIICRLYIYYYGVLISLFSFQIFTILFILILDI